MAALLGLQAGTQGAFFSQLTCIAFIFEDAEFVACGRNARQTKDFNRVSRTSLFNIFAKRTNEGTHTAVAGTSYHHVAWTQGTTVHEHRGHRAAALVQVGFNNITAGERIGVSLKLEDIGLQNNSFKQVVDVFVLLCGNIHKHVRAAPLFGDNLVFGEFLAHTIGRGTRLVNLIHGHHNRYARSLGMVNSFNGLRHHAVVGRHHQNNDVGNSRTTCTHGGKGFVARRVDEGNLLAVNFDNGCTNVLGNTARFALRYARFTDGVQKRSLAMVNVTHNSNHGWTRK